MEERLRTDAFTERDYRFENLVVWGVNYSKGDYNFLTSKQIQSFSEHKTHRSPLINGVIKFPTQRVKQVYFISKRNNLNKSKSSDEQVEEDKDSILKSFSSEDHPEGDQLFPDKHPLGRDLAKDLEDEEHQRLLEEQEASYKEDERNLNTYSLKDFPLADPETINKLADTHSKYFRLLTKLQDTHTPEDFVTAFRIQDRIAYLLDNQTLLYKTLTKQLIKYLEKINDKLEKYLKDITLKQEDLKRMNAQISRFNEYDRKTQSRLDQAAKETNLFQKDLQTYQDSLRGLQTELQAELQTAPESSNGTKSPDELKLKHEIVVH